jgi:dipeptidyl aminopeptidase/acylaminoacyl peptidase
VAQADGSKAHLLLQGADFISKAGWSPDGSRLAYIQSPTGTRGQLRIVRLDGTDDRLLASGASTFAWSPDGSWIAFTRGPWRYPKVALIRPDGGDQHDVAAGSNPAWRLPGALPSHRRPCIVHGTSKADVIHGTNRGDVIFAGRGSDHVYGGGGNDVIVGGLGQDRLFGGAGSDVLVTRDHLRDYLFGGPGTDRAYHDRVDVLSSVEH